MTQTSLAFIAQITTDVVTQQTKLNVFLLLLVEHLHSKASIRAKFTSCGEVSQKETDKKEL